MPAKIRRGSIVAAALLVLAAPLVAESRFVLSFRGPPAFAGAAGEEVTRDYYCVLTSSGGGTGVQGWSMGVAAENAVITRISFLDTDIFPLIGPDSFTKRELTSGPGNEGAVAAVLISSSLERVLPPDSSLTIARITVKAVVAPGCGRVTLRYVEGLKGTGNPVPNVVTQDTISRFPEKVPLEVPLFSAGTDCPGVNPDGWIQAAGWNLLFPLTNPFGCDGGGAVNMLRNWVFPHDAPREGPRPGDGWGDIEFGGRAAAGGFPAVHILEKLDPTRDPVRWVDAAYLGSTGLPGILPADVPSGDRVDLGAFLEFLNQRLAPALGVAPALAENVLALAQTHVLNLGAEPLCLDLCTSSDGSLQAWVNDALAVNTSTCRAAAPDCQERTPVLLEPGLNRITVLSWKGTGPWGFLLGLADPATGQRISNFDRSDILFLGSDPARVGSPVEPSQVLVARTVEGEEGCSASGPLRVRLKGNGRGSGEVRITESLPAAEIGGVVEVSPGGTVATQGGLTRISWSVAAEVLSSEGVSYGLLLDGGRSVFPEGEVNGCTAVVGAVRLIGPRGNGGPHGVFEVSQDIGTPEDLASGPGSFQVDPGADGQAGTPDDLLSLRGSGRDIGAGGDSHRFAYLHVAGDFSLTVQVAGRTFPATGGRLARYGIMARRDCSPDARFSFIQANLEADPGPQADHPRGTAVAWQFRRNHGVAASTDESQRLVMPDRDGGGPEIANQPQAFRMVRRGATFTGYASNGQEWFLVGSDTWYGLEPDEELLVGLAACRHDSSPQAGTITFTDFQLGAPPRAEIFDDEAGSQGVVVYQSSFESGGGGEGPGGGGLPASLRFNCGSGCGGFSPQLIGGRLRLTQEGVLQSSTSAFLEGVTIPSQSGKIVVEYTVYASHSGLAAGGDANPGHGLTFTIIGGAGAQRVGDPAGGLGYASLSDSLADAAPSFAVEYDAWNGGGYNEGAGSPTADGRWHLGINAGGNVNSLVMRDTNLPDLFDPRGVRQRVEITSEGKVSVYLVAGPGGGQEGDTLLAEASGEPLGSQGQTQAAVGFTASTGATSMTTEIDDMLVEVVDCSDTPEVAAIQGPTRAQPGSSITLDAGASSAGTGDLGERLQYRWSILSGADKARLEVSTENPQLARLSFIQEGDVVVGVVVDDGHCNPPVSASTSHSIQVAAPGWLSYDGNGDGLLDVSDPVFHLSFLFLGGLAPGCRPAMDFNGDQLFDISDPVAALNHLFLGGRPPAAGSGCQSFPGCAGGTGCR